MTSEERRILTGLAFDVVMRRIQDSPRFLAYKDNCMRAIAGAAVLLERDPEELARQMSDGRLGEYIKAAETTIPLPLDDPQPIRDSMEEVLRKAADDLDRERERLERKLGRLSETLAAAAEDLRVRAQRAEHMRYQWRSLKEDEARQRAWRVARETGGLRTGPSSLPPR